MLRRGLLMLWLSSALIGCDRDRELASKRHPAAPATRPASSFSSSAAPARPASFVVPLPAGNDAAQRPLFILLHGLGASGASIRRQFDADRVAAERGFIFVAPDGTLDSSGRRFWNAGPSCCNFDGLPVDDVAYVRSLIERGVAEHRADAKRVYVVGYSNGGFMAQRSACELPERIAAVVSMAGAAPPDEMRCKAPASVAVVELHGTADRMVPYQGGRPLGRRDLRPHPSAQRTVARWAKALGCGKTHAAGPLDLDSELAGSETHVERFADCRRGALELWTVSGGGHFNAVGSAAFRAAVDFALAHPKR